MAPKQPDLRLLEDSVPPKVLKAMRIASDLLSKLGVHHLLVGGLAVGAHGFPRSTKDVDFLVADNAFEVHGGGIVTARQGVPLQIDGVAVDHLSATPEEEHLRRLLEETPHGSLQVVPIEALVFLKLKAGRAKDRLDVIELAKAGIDTARCRQYLVENASGLLQAFDVLAEAAAREDD